MTDPLNQNSEANMTQANAAAAVATELHEGGYYAGRIKICGIEYALIVAPKAEGEHADIRWNDSDNSVEGARSFCDGLANTNAMVEAGSDVAKWARGLRIGGFDDWYIPSQDELEIVYRAFKPTDDENTGWGRSGINVSAFPPTYPYSANPAVRTSNEKFQKDGSEAFDTVWYWTSTQHAGDSDYAWGQDFEDGYQFSGHKSDGSRVRAVRRLPI